MSLYSIMVAVIDTFVNYNYSYGKFSYLIILQGDIHCFAILPIKRKQNLGERGQHETTNTG